MGRKATLDQATPRLRQGDLEAIRALQAEDILHAVPDSSFGICLDPYAPHINITVPLAAPVHDEHQCIYGGKVADRYSCLPPSGRSPGRRLVGRREVNIISRSLASATCPVVTSYACKSGRQLVWNYCTPVLLS